MAIHTRVLRGDVGEAILDSEDVLRFGTRICVPRVGDLIQMVQVAQNSSYSIHWGTTKMYRD